MDTSQRKWNLHNFRSVFLLMGIVQKPTARSYFLKRGVISTPGFADVISRGSFELICKFLHFIDNESLPTYQGPPILFKIYPVISHLNIKFQTLYLPNKNTAIDERLTVWKEHLSIRQYLPLKTSKFGIKTFKLCESRKGYMWCFLVYTGKNTVQQLSLITPDTPKNSSCSNGAFRNLVWSWTYTVNWQLQQSRISKEAKDRTFHWLCWHTGKKYTAALI